MKSRNLLAGMAMAIALGTTFVACDKDDDDTPTLRTKEYNLVPVGNSGVGGKVTVQENANNTLNITVALNNSVKDTVHISHIHSGSTTSPGPIAIPLADINGTGSDASATTTNISTISYDSLMNYMGYINVHYSAYKVDSLISQVNIGKSNQ